MRILSQDELPISDISYENCGIRMYYDFSEKPKWIIDAYQSKWVYKMAEYSTAEKVKKAMEMLRDRYTGKDETIFDIAHIKRSSTDNFYFQFPADDEIEVQQ